MPSIPPPPPPGEGRPAAVDWVGRHLAGLWSGELAGSERFTGGAEAAATALASYDVSGYGSKRNEVWPAARRGASALSPWIRHGLLSLPEVWEAVAGGPARDVRKFRDELLWQEYARHLYARLGTALGHPLRYQPVEGSPGDADGWSRDMACLDLVVGELEGDGWLVNQTRMWLASQWTVRCGRPWRDGEDAFFHHLLDGSRAANRLGWQWAVGAGTGRPYGFSRWQVEKRAKGVCTGCALRDTCPIQAWPADRTLEKVTPDPLLRHDPDPQATAGPTTTITTGQAPAAVWITAESLGDDDPALRGNPDLPAVFVWDRPLLTDLRLSAKRLIFLAESLGDLAARREVDVRVGDPVDELSGLDLAATFTPVPGWRRRRDRLQVVTTHPWPWLRRPGAGPLSSFSAWRRAWP